MSNQQYATWVNVWVIFADLWCRDRRACNRSINYNVLAVAMHDVGDPTLRHWSQCIDLARLLCDVWLHGEAVAK